MAEPRYCSNCGTLFPPGARYCPNCGSEVVAPPVVPSPAAAVPVTHPPAANPAPVARPSRSTYLIWVPIAVIALALLAWAILAGLPFGREPRQPERPQMDVVSEREVTTGTLAQIGDPEPEVDDRPLTPPPAPRPEPAPAAEPGAGEISEGEAQRALQRFVASRRDYNVSARCVAISSLGYKNAGYTFDVRDRCSGASLGRWRVDSEDPSGVFRQRADGRYLKP